VLHGGAGGMKETKFKQTEVGMIPSDWDVKKIGEFTKLQAGGTPSTLCDEFWGGNIRWMNSGELNKKRIYDVAGRITELGLNSSSTHLIPSNCVLVGLAGQGKTRGTAAINYVELCTNQSIAALFPSKTHNSEYLYHNIDNRYEELRELSSGDGGRGGLNLKILANLFVALPSKEEQQLIANALSDVDTLINNLEKLIAKKKNIKQGAMQELLTGKKRLPGFGSDERQKECHSERSAKREVEESSGYKMTELGMIPSDWEVKTFGDVGKGFSAGATPYRQVDRYYEGDIKWVSSGELDYNVIQETQEHISIEAVKATNLTLHPKNTC
jgi:restriction endonuclease S subunit